MSTPSSRYPQRRYPHYHLAAKGLKPTAQWTAGGQVAQISTWYLILTAANRAASREGARVFIPSPTTITSARLYSEPKRAEA